MTTDFRKSAKLIVASLICMGQILIGSYANAANNLCTPTGYTVGYFNGIWNTIKEAGDGLDSIKALNGSTFNGERIQYLQWTIIGWIPASIWAVYALSQYKTDRKIEAALKSKNES